MPSVQPEGNVLMSLGDTEVLGTPKGLYSAVVENFRTADISAEGVDRK